MGVNTSRMMSATPLHHELARSARALWLAEATPPGTPVTEAALAARLSVSRTPLRAALRLLEQAGVTARQGRAMVVANLARDLPEEAARDPAETLAAEIVRAHAEGALQGALREADLMRQLDQPRGVVSRALGRLEKLGVVARNPAQGWHFAPGLTTVEDRAAAQRFRLVLEPAALLEPGYRLDPSFARSMRTGHEAVLSRPWRDQHAVSFFEMNAAFHAGLAAGSGNRFFVDAVEAQNRLRALRNTDWRFGAERAHASCREHLRVLDALESGNPPRAAALLVEHLMSAGP
jgi:DNA-binding GntR family transcriptional regulator